MRYFLRVGEIECSFKRNPGLIMSRRLQVRDNLPNSLQVQWPNFDNVSRFLGFQDPISPPAGHAGHIQEFCAVDEAIVLSTGDTDSFDFNLEAQRALIFPKRCCDSWLHTWRRYLAGRVEYLLSLRILEVLYTRWWRRISPLWCRWVSTNEHRRPRSTAFR